MSRTRPKPNDTHPEMKRGWRGRLSGFKYVPPFLKMIWHTHRPFTAAMIGLRLIRSVFPVATLWIAKLIIDTVIALRGKSGDLTRLWRLVALEIGIVLVNELLTRGSAYVESVLGDMVSNYTSVKLMEHAGTLDVYQFENPDFYDQLERARRQTIGRVSLIAQLLSVAQDLLTLFSLAAALLFYSPWLLILLIVSILPAFFGETHYAAREYLVTFRRTPERRLLDYLRYVGASDETAKEVQMFGLSAWLIERFRVLSESFLLESERLLLRKSLVSTGLALVGMAGYYIAYAMILLRAVLGSISIGTLTFLSLSFVRSRDLLQRVIASAISIYEQSLYLKDLFDFFERKPNIVSVPNAPPVPNPIN